MDMTDYRKQIYGLIKSLTGLDAEHYRGMNEYLEGISFTMFNKPRRESRKA